MSLRVCSILWDFTKDIEIRDNSYELHVIINPKSKSELTDGYLSAPQRDTLLSVAAKYPIQRLITNVTTENETS
jgi:hypothetical protein